jgi:hypothetical protein
LRVSSGAVDLQARQSHSGSVGLSPARRRSLTDAGKAAAIRQSAAVVKAISTANE